MSQFKIKEKNFISVVVHVKENYSTLQTFLLQINNILGKNFDTFEFIIVNNSNKILLSDVFELNFNDKINGAINVINLSWSHNIEDAMRAGIDLAIGDFVFEFDSTLIDYEDSLLIEVYKKCLEGFDSVAAEPKNKRKGISSRLFYNILKKSSFKNVEFTTETFRIVSRRMLNRSAGAQETFRYRKSNYHYSGLLTTSILYNNNSNNKILEDFGIIEKISLGSNILIYYSNIGVKIGVALSLFFLLFSIFIGVFAISSYIFNGTDIQNGWTTTILFLSVIFSGLFGILTIFSKFMEVILREIQGINSYTYKSIDHYN